MPTIAADGVRVELAVVPPGEFLMGSGNEYFSEAPAHPVAVPGFLLGRHPVTRAQWQAVLGDDPAGVRDDPDLPVTGVDWDRAGAFCRRLSALAGRPVRLPSEAEWEYACRAGTTGDFWFGPWGPCLDDADVPEAAARALEDHAWFDRNSGGRPRPVGQKRPNPWGLSDLLGNVWEWCADVWHGTYVGAPADGRAWTEGEGRQRRRCLRGGAWDMNAFRCRSAYRSWDDRGQATDRIGFRVAADAVD